MNSRYTIVCTVLTAVCLGCCSHGQVGEGKRFNPDADLIAPWTPEAQKKQPFEPPFVAEYAGSGKLLFFVATRHGVGLNNATSKTLKHEIERFRPQVVIVEGLRSDQRETPKSTEALNKCAADEFSHCGEPLYAVQMARKHDIPWIGGEPSDLEIFKSVHEMGYSARDLVGFYLARQIPEWKREGSFKDVSSHSDEFLKQNLAAIGVQDDDFRFRQFNKWFYRKTGRRFVPEELTTESTRPNHEKDAPYLQKFSYRVGLVRNTHILRLIAEKLEHFDRVLVEYGAGHHVELEKALRALLPDVTNKKLFSDDALSAAR